MMKAIPPSEQSAGCIFICNFYPIANLINNNK
jgi:hypothetical protein